MPHRILEIAGADCRLALLIRLDCRLVCSPLQHGCQPFGRYEPAEEAVGKLGKTEIPAREYKDRDHDHGAGHAVANILADGAAPLHRLRRRIGVCRAEGIRAVAVGTEFAAQDPEIDEEPEVDNWSDDQQRLFEASSRRRIGQKAKVSREPAGEDGG